MQSIECDSCGDTYKKKSLQRINGRWRCRKCYIKKKKEHREYLKRDILGIRKREDLIKEWAEKRTLQPPKIKGQIKRGRGSKNPYLGIYLTSVEKYIIYKKHSHLGSEVARKRLKEITEHFNKMINNWKEQKKEDEEISLKFKEEFAKLIMQEI